MIAMFCLKSCCAWFLRQRFCCEQDPLIWFLLPVCTWGCCSVSLCRSLHSHSFSSSWTSQTRMTTDHEPASDLHHPALHTDPDDTTAKTHRNTHISLTAIMLFTFKGTVDTKNKDSVIIFSPSKPVWTQKVIFYIQYNECKSSKWQNKQ